VAAQRLCRKLCNNCKAPLDATPSRENLLKSGLREEDLHLASGLMRAVGCPQCVGGYKGRFAILEAMEVTEDIRRLIIEGKSSMDLKKAAIQNHDMITLRRCALLNAMRGRTTMEEVMRMTMGDD
jgi:type IV pilus assembly protein PilB